LLTTSADPRDRVLAAKVEAFVRAMPQPDSRRLALARALRKADEQSRDAGRDKGKDR